MPVVGVARLKGVTTNAAHKGSVVAVQLHVVLEGVAGAQLLPANLQMIRKRLFSNSMHTSIEVGSYLAL